MLDHISVSVVPLVNCLVKHFEEAEQSELRSEVNTGLELMDSLVLEVTLSDVLLLEVDHIEDVLEIAVSQDSVISILAKKTCVEGGLVVLVHLVLEITGDLRLAGSFAIVDSSQVIVKIEDGVTQSEGVVVLLVEGLFQVLDEVGILA